MRFSIDRYVHKFFLLIGDLGGAFLLAWLVRSTLPHLPSATLILQIWVLAIAVFWIITYDADKNFRIDTCLTYTRVLKVACFAALSYLVFFTFTREFYSLKFLLYVTILWIGLAFCIRWLLRKFTPPSKGLTFEELPTILQKQNNVAWTLIADPKAINLSNYDLLLIDFGKQYPKEGLELLKHAHVVGLPIFSTPQIIEHLTGKIAIEHLNDFWVESTFYVDPIYLRLKRLIDIVGTLVLLPLILPLCGLIALLIFVTSGGPVLYRQTRMGLNDTPFTIVKFRTMVVDAEKMGAGSTGKDDLRITSFGKILRKLRLDELPQFYNVIKGDMSIIGPRPEYSVLVDDYIKNIPLFQVRHWLRPGITGWAQVMHGYASSQDEMWDKVRYDMFYLKNLSLWLDIIIVFRTVWIVLTGFGSR
jgi:lipopolysaccharide/colanic/teichoic acid biosynthesis glycosyltransferase